MRRDQLEHLIRAAGHALGADEVIVIGSQAVLASVPSGLPPEAVRSIEADILPLDDPDETKADLIDGLLGEASSFQETHGIYAQGVGQHTARLPRGWEDRLVELRNDNTGGVTGRCLEPHDVCVSKLLAGRPKDNEFCQALIRAGVVEGSTLLERLELTDATPDERRRIEVMIVSAA
ncbi:MAG: DUF6036 family nucleotidyltransferase [Actinomycetota bacterium]